MGYVIAFIWLCAGAAGACVFMFFRELNLMQRDKEMLRLERLALARRTQGRAIVGSTATQLSTWKSRTVTPSQAMKDIRPPLRVVK